MKSTKTSLLAGAFLLIATTAAPAAALSPIENLGSKLFFDSSLSVNGTQSCATCHAPEAGFVGPDSAVNAGGTVYEGAFPNHFGNRKPPTSAYAGDSPPLHQDASGDWFGGMFWDGRATGAVLGDPLAEQAQGPYLNPLEQALANPKILCVKVKKSAYSGLFEEVWGTGSLNCVKDAKRVYERIGRSVAAYERSTEVNPFNSKFDQFWDNATAAGRDVTKIKCGTASMGSGGMGSGGMGSGGMGGGGMGGAMGCGGGGTDSDRWTTFRSYGLNDQELQGLAVFNDPKLANCASCHTLEPGIDGYPLFTDFGYDNIGTPKNPDNPFYKMSSRWNPKGAAWVDFGLGGFLKSARFNPEFYQPELGKFKVPTLRNVDLRPSPQVIKAYGHNGYFKSLSDIVVFYHWRAMMDSGMGGGMAGMFPPPEVDSNRTPLNKFPRPQVDNIVLFLKTLSDGYVRR